MLSLYCWMVLSTQIQAAIAITLAYLTLGCHFKPGPLDVSEVTLMKLLYLYDPTACELAHNYNYTLTNDSWNAPSRSVPVHSNRIAASFRLKIKLNVALHCVWAILGAVVTLGKRRYYGFHLTFALFGLCGVSLLILDIICATHCISDAPYTRTEASMLNYVTGNHLPVPRFEAGVKETSWVSLLFGYCHLRFIVFWFMNLWLIIDVHYDGLAIYRNARKPHS